MKLLILFSAVFLSACKVQTMKMERFTLKTIDGREIVLVCPVKLMTDGLQVHPNRCHVEMIKE